MLLNYPSPAFAAEQQLTLTVCCRGSWRDLYLSRPHMRFDGVYVSRNTYLRTGLVEWRVKNPVHLVCYFRYYRQAHSRALYNLDSRRSLQSSVGLCIQVLPRWAVCVQNKSRCS